MLATLFFLYSCASGTSKQELPPFTELAAFDQQQFQASAPRVYRIGEGDSLGIRVLMRSNLAPVLDLNNVRVSEEGMIYIPLAGEIKAAGLTERELRQAVEVAFSSELREPIINVKVTQALNNRVFLLGEIKNPGSYTLDANTSVLELIAIAGGESENADMSRIALFRTLPVSTGNGGRVTGTTLDIQALLDKAEFHQNIGLQAGDIVYVPDDAIANSNRYFNHLNSIVQPFASMISAIGNIVFINREFRAPN